MQLRNIMTKPPQYVSPSTPIGDAASMMRNRDIGMLLVAENEKLVGTVTDRDIVIRAVAEGLDPRSAKTRDVMTKDTLYCFDDQDTTEAAQLMEERQIRRLAILDREKKLVGVVSLGDLAVRSDDEALSGEVMKHVASPRR
jgi:CBS domain-containing protein